MITVIVCIVLSWVATGMVEGFKWRPPEKTPHPLISGSPNTYHVWRLLQSCTIFFGIIAAMFVPWSLAAAVIIFLAWAGANAFYNRILCWVSTDDWNFRQPDFEFLKWSFKRLPVWADWLRLGVCMGAAVILTLWG